VKTIYVLIILNVLLSNILKLSISIRGCIQKFPDWVITKYTLTTINTRRETTQMVMVAKLTRLTHKIVMQLHLMAESCTIYGFRSRRPVRKLLDTPSQVLDISVSLYYTSQLKVQTFIYTRIVVSWLVAQCNDVVGPSVTVLRKCIDLYSVHDVCEVVSNKNKASVTSEKLGLQLAESCSKAVVKFWTLFNRSRGYLVMTRVVMW
jgi:hypothetical protein